MITEAYANKDLEWIRKSMNNLTKITFAAILGWCFVICSSLISYKFWIETSFDSIALNNLYVNLYGIDDFFIRHLRFYQW
jgi:hypothetical protein